MSDFKDLPRKNRVTENEGGSVTQWGTQKEYSRFTRIENPQILFHEDNQGKYKFP